MNKFRAIRNYDGVCLGEFPSKDAEIFIALSRRDAEDFKAGRRPDGGGYSLEPVGTTPTPPVVDAFECAIKYCESQASLYDMSPHYEENPPDRIGYYSDIYREVANVLRTKACKPAVEAELARLNRDCKHPGCCCICGHQGRCPECGPTAGISEAICD